ncbi:hypothetical protein V7S43_015299 [Phytophthora oleae]|uniref:Uncharacterized protein n=1 Tax=Phytophthora oleae TaxID=2107226 RepID=A0ABD3EZY0_9STRA
MTDAEEQDQASSLRAFVTSSDGIIAKTALQYLDFVRCRRRVVDTTKWLKLKSERGVDLYTERVELRSTRNNVCNMRHSMPEDCSNSGSFGPLRTTMVSAFGGGTRPGTLTEVMDGLYADSTEQMQVNTPIQYGNILDCGVVRTFRTRSDANPHEFFGIKFVEKFGHIPGVIDQLCWVERMGIMVTAGKRFGFQLMKSVESEDRASDQSVRRVNMSVCYLYCQVAPDAVDMFIRGIVELPGSSKLRKRQETINAAGDYILAAIHGRECQRMKTIATLIEKSKTERESLIACHCSKVVRGLEKVVRGNTSMPILCINSLLCFIWYARKCVQVVEKRCVVQSWWQCLMLTVDGVALKFQASRSAVPSLSRGTAALVTMAIYRIRWAGATANPNLSV